MEVIIVALGVGFILFVAALLIIKNVLYVCGPNEAIVFSGRRHQDNGEEVGFRIIKGGRGYRVPLLEKVDHVDLTNMIIEVAVTNAYSKGGIPLTVQGVANLKIAGHAPLINNAIQRFLGMQRAEIMKIAKDTLEGSLRGVLSQLTPEEVNEDKITFAEKLLKEAETDLSRLGLVLDTLKIQNVSDEVKYLGSIGRKQSAEVVKRARITEADAKAFSTQREAENMRSARIAAIESEMAVVKAETERRIKDAQTKKDAMVAEEIGKVKAQIARASADLKVQEARVEQVRRKLEADVIAPAQAAMEAARSDAKGRSAKIVEDGKATVAVLDQMIATWQRGGDSARDIFLTQKLNGMLNSLVSTMDDVSVDRVTLLPASAGGTGMQTARTVEELRAALGVDVPALVERFAAGRAAPAPALVQAADAPPAPKPAAPSNKGPSPSGAR